MRIKGQIPPPPTHTLVKQVLKMINHFDMYEYEFADAIGVNRSTLSKLFKGRGKMWEGER